MEKVITVQVKSVYGVEAIYPNCADAKWFAQIAGTKTLTRATIAAIKALGYVVRVEHATDIEL